MDGSMLARRLSRLKAISRATFPQMAAAAGCTPGQVSHLCTGHRSDPAMSQMVGLATLFEVDLAWLSTGVGQSPSDEHLVAVAQRKGLGRRRAAQEMPTIDREPYGPVIVRDGFDQTSDRSAA